MSAKSAATPALRFIPSRLVRCGFTPVPQLTVRHQDPEEPGPQGKLEGFVVEPAERKVRYAVVQPYGFFEKPRLVPLSDARLDPEADALLVDAEVRRCEPFDAARFPKFSDDDMLTALFAA